MATVQQLLKTKEGLENRKENLERQVISLKQDARSLKKIVDYLENGAKHSASCTGSAAETVLRSGNYSKRTECSDLFKIVPGISYDKRVRLPYNAGQDHSKHQAAMSKSSTYTRQQCKHDAVQTQVPTNTTRDSVDTIPPDSEPQHRAEAQKGRHIPKELDEVIATQEADAEIQKNLDNLKLYGKDMKLSETDMTKIENILNDINNDKVADSPFEETEEDHKKVVETADHVNLPQTKGPENFPQQPLDSDHACRETLCPSKSESENKKDTAIADLLLMNQESWDMKDVKSPGTNQKMPDLSEVKHETSDVTGMTMSGLFTDKTTQKMLDVPDKKLSGLFTVKTNYKKLDVTLSDFLPGDDFSAKAVPENNSELDDLIAINPGRRNSNEVSPTENTTPGENGSFPYPSPGFSDSGLALSGAGPSASSKSVEINSEASDLNSVSKSVPNREHHKNGETSSSLDSSISAAREVHLKRRSSNGTDSAGRIQKRRRSESITLEAARFPAGKTIDSASGVDVKPEKSDAEDVINSLKNLCLDSLTSAEKDNVNKVSKSLASLNLSDKSSSLESESSSEESETGVLPENSTDENVYKPKHQNDADRLNKSDTEEVHTYVTAAAEPSAKVCAVKTPSTDFPEIDPSHAAITFSETENTEQLLSSQPQAGKHQEHEQDSCRHKEIETSLEVDSKNSRPQHAVEGNPKNKPRNVHTELDSMHGDTGTQNEDKGEAIRDHPTLLQGKFTKCANPDRPANLDETEITSSPHIKQHKSGTLYDVCVVL